MLTPFHHAVSIGIPSAWDPGELHRSSRVRPKLLDHLVIPAATPVAIEPHDRPHLPVGGGDLVIQRVFVQRQMNAKTHLASIVRRMREFDLAHRSRPLAVEARCGMFVIPDVRAIPLAPSLAIVATFPAKESPIVRAEAGLGAQRRCVEKRRLLHDIGEVALDQTLHEEDGVALELRELGCGAGGDIPRVGVLGRVIIPDAIARSVPGQTIWKMPGDEEGELCRAAPGPSCWRRANHTAAHACRHAGRPFHRR